MSDLHENLIARNAVLVEAAKVRAQLTRTRVSNEELVRKLPRTGIITLAGTVAVIVMAVLLNQIPNLPEETMMFVVIAFLLALLMPFGLLAMSSDTELAAAREQFTDELVKGGYTSDEAIVIFDHVFRQKNA